MWNELNWIRLGWVELRSDGDKGWVALPRWHRSHVSLIRSYPRRALDLFSGSALTRGVFSLKLGWSKGRWSVSKAGSFQHPWPISAALGVSQAIAHNPQSAALTLKPYLLTCSLYDTLMSPTESSCKIVSLFITLACLLPLWHSQDPRYQEETMW